MKFSYLNFDKENFSFNLYNEKELIYESKVGRKFNLSSGYDLTKLEAGTYTVVLSSYDNEYTYNIEK